jgi:glutamate dehydrogenase (NAD(P)+)
MGLDMGLTEDDAAIIQDELGDRGAAVGTPAHLGGIAYDQLGVTGFGVAEAADTAAVSLGWPLSQARVSIQGFGAVGSAAARRFADLGATIVAVSTAQGAVYDPSGLDVAELIGARAESGDDFVTRFGAGSVRPAGEELLVPCEVLVPAAEHDVIDESNAARIKARLIVEGANLPTTAKAQAILAERDVSVIPDFAANAGGVIAAAFAMDARYSGFRPGTEAIFAAVTRMLRANVSTILAEAARRRVTPRSAGLRLAQDRVRAAMRSKGQLPRK